jgi:hypothetical protein
MELGNLYESGCIINFLGSIKKEKSSLYLHYPQTYDYWKYDENMT